MYAVAMERAARDQKRKQADRRLREFQSRVPPHFYSFVLRNIC